MSSACDRQRSQLLTIASILYLTSIGRFPSCFQKQLNTIPTLSQQNGQHMTQVQHPGGASSTCAPVQGYIQPTFDWICRVRIWFFHSSCSKNIYTQTLLYKLPFTIHLRYSSLNFLVPRKSQLFLLQRHCQFFSVSDALAAEQDSDPDPHRRSVHISQEIFTVTLIRA